MTRSNDILFGTFLIVFGISILAWTTAYPRDLGQWEDSSPAIREWYQNLKMPDAPYVSCCGEADGYYADKINVVDGKTYATITDDRPDKPLNRKHIEIGTQFLIPDFKLKYDSGNPTGHNILFLSVYDLVYCFVQGTGI